MQNNQYPYQLLFFPFSQTFLSCTTLPPQAFMDRYSNLQIQNLPNLESKYPITNSADFTVEVTEMNGEKKKYSLEELAKVVPTHLSEGVVSPEIKDNKLTIVTHQKLDESYSNKILIETNRDSFVVIPNYLIEKAREEEKNLRIKQAEKDESDSFSNPITWGGEIRHRNQSYSTVKEDIDENLTSKNVDQIKSSTIKRSIYNSDSSRYKNVKIPIVEKLSVINTEQLSKESEIQIPNL